MRKNALFWAKYGISKALDLMIEASYHLFGIFPEKDQNLFDIDESAASLDLERSDHFRTMSAKLLYLAPRGRPDIMTAVSFLCTRVQQPNVED